MSAYRRIAGAVRITEWLVVGTFVQECFKSRFKNRCRDIEIITPVHACIKGSFRIFSIVQLQPRLFKFIDTCEFAFAYLCCIVSCNVICFP